MDCIIGGMHVKSVGTLTHRKKRKIVDTCGVGVAVYCREYGHCDGKLHDQSFCLSRMGLFCISIAT